MNFVYILLCADQTLYTGWTNNLEKRIKTHQSKKGAKYTMNRLPVKLIYFEEYETRSLAQKREYEIKKMSRKQKIDLIKNSKKEGVFLGKDSNC